MRGRNGGSYVLKSHHPRFAKEYEAAGSISESRQALELIRAPHRSAQWNSTANVRCLRFSLTLRAPPPIFLKFRNQGRTRPIECRQIQFLYIWNREGVLFHRESPQD